MAEDDRKLRRLSAQNIGGLQAVGARKDRVSIFYRCLQNGWLMKLAGRLERLLKPPKHSGPNRSLVEPLSAQTPGVT
jgi:hypothetical protein